MPVTVAGEGRRWRRGGDATAAGKELARIGRYQKAYGGERAPQARAPVMAAGWRQGGLRTQQYSHVFFNVVPPTLGPREQGFAISCHGSRVHTNSGTDKSTARMGILLCFRF